MHLGFFVQFMQANVVLMYDMDLHDDTMISPKICYMQALLDMCNSLLYQVIFGSSGDTAMTDLGSS
jgi:flagellar biosynthesis/type III secretory pathway chaperone